MFEAAAGGRGSAGRNVRAKAALKREILARSWYPTRQRLLTKAEEYGGRVIDVDLTHISETCPECGHVDRNNRRTQANFKCVLCDHEDHADVVGAINILPRGMTAGAHPVAGRGGHATGTEMQISDAERADEASNKSLREPEASSTGPGGSRSAKPHSHDNDLDSGGDPLREMPPPRGDPTSGARDGP